MAGDSLLPSCFEVDVQGAQQLRLAHRAEQTEEGRPPDPRGLGLGGGCFPGDQAVALKEGVGTLFRTTVASQPAGLRAPSSDKAETQKRRLQLVRSISCIAPDRFPEGETKEAFKVKWAGANQLGKLGRTVTLSQMVEA